MKLEDSMGKQLEMRRQKAQILPFIQNGEYYFSKGMKAYRRRDLYKSKKYLQRAIQFEPKDPMMVYQLAIVLTELGEYQQSNQLFHSIITGFDSDMNECYYFIANNYAHLGLFHEAFKHAKTYIERCPTGEFAEDTEDLLELLSIEAEDDESGFDDQDELIVYQEKAHEYLENGKLTEAIALLEQMIKEYPEFWSAQNNLSLAYFYSGQTIKAYELIEEILEKNPGNLYALCNKVAFLYSENKKAEVELLITKLERVHPLLMEHRYKLGATFGLVGRYELSFKWLRKLQKQGFIGDATFHYWLSYAAYFTGHKKRSKTEWQKVIKENPDKIGSEPWLKADLENEHNMTIARWLKSPLLDEKLYGLFLASYCHEIESLFSSELFKQHLQKPSIEKDFATYILYIHKKIEKPHVPNYITSGFEITTMLFQYNEEDTTVDHELSLYWLSLYEVAVSNNYNLTNHSAWAAAIDYVWRKDELFYKITQKEIAEKYKITTATLRKYVKFVNEIN